MITSNGMLFSGEIHKYKTSTIYFGNALFNPKRNKLKGVESCFLHQVHGKEILKSYHSQQKADGHYTSQKNQALFIKTADCMPVFVTDGELIMGLHIGWRGLMKNILSEGLARFKNKKLLRVFVGPHIGFDSFQLDLNSAAQLLSGHKITLASAIELEIARPSFSQRSHVFIDLKRILIQEARKNQVKSSQMHFSSVDTYKSPHHYSHRRNRQRLGQNFSYIAK